MTETIFIDQARALKLMDQAVEERGGSFVYYDQFAESYREYGTCRYQVDGQPACLVGLALSKAGLTVEELELLEGSSIQASYEQGRLPAERLEITHEALKVLELAQTLQDNDATWGEALESARSEVQQ
jgi:hypothetical protein